MLNINHLGPHFLGGKAKNSQLLLGLFLTEKIPSDSIINAAMVPGELADADCNNSIIGLI
jgi:hypothetical protein